MEEATETDPLLVRNFPSGELSGTSLRPRYDSRLSSPADYDRDLTFTEYHGTFLAELRETNSEHLPQMDNPVTVALYRCNERVLKPYRRLLLFVGWEPWFDDPVHCCQKAINIIHPLVVVAFVLAGYVIQYAACFRRDSAGGEEPWVPQTNVSNSTMGCKSVLISQYIVPDLLHSIAYIYSFYLLRISQSEQLPTLIERVFLQTSPTQSGFLSQGRLIRVMMLLLGMCVGWVLLSSTAQIIHVVATYQEISFSWLSPQSTPGRIFLLILMLLSFVCLDVVYTAVVINYCVQCCLMVFYIEGLQQKLSRKLIELSTGIREIAEIESHLRSLNYTTAVALSIVLFNFGTMAFLGYFQHISRKEFPWGGFPAMWWGILIVHYGADSAKSGELACLHYDASAVRIFDKYNHFDTWMYVSTTLSVIFWISIIALPVVQAARLSAACNSLRKIGHELRVKPFVYQDVSDEKLDSFLLYTSSLNLRAKIFLVPVKTSYIAGISVAVAFIILLLFQTEVIRIWL